MTIKILSIHNSWRFYCNSKDSTNLDMMLHLTAIKQPPNPLNTKLQTCQSGIGLRTTVPWVAIAPNNEHGAGSDLDSSQRSVSSGYDSSPEMQSSENNCVPNSWFLLYCVVLRNIQHLTNILDNVKLQLVHLSMQVPRHYWYLGWIELDCFCD